MQFNEKSLPEGRIQLVVNRDDLKDVLREIVTETMGENGSGAKRQDCYLTAQQVADRLGVTKTTLWRWEKEHYLKPVRFGSKVRYRESDILALIDDGDDEQ